MKDDDPLAQKLLTILPHLNEKQRRLVLAAEARSWDMVGVLKLHEPLEFRVQLFTKACENWRAMNDADLALGAE